MTSASIGATTATELNKPNDIPALSGCQTYCPYSLSASSTDTAATIVPRQKSITKSNFLSN
ncbi:hypothetical protein LB505_005581 [Fusarium chuoi]|nr:hypothetical protein LB505_005581 [Fusarium chuoi]